MSTITTDSESWIGSTLIDRDDSKLGTVEAIYFDEQNGRPQWMAVKSGLLGHRHSFVPLAGAMVTGDAITTPYDKAQVADAPKVDTDEDLHDDEVVELYGHYGLSYEPGATAGDDVTMEREIVPPAAAPGTQAEDDMLIATGHEPEVGPMPAHHETHAEQDMRIATGQAEPYRAA